MTASTETVENNEEENQENNLTINVSNEPQTPTEEFEASPRSFVASDSELNDRENNTAKTNTTKLQSTSTNLSTHLTTSLSHHDRGKTVTNVQKIYQKGEQPKTDKYEIWAWYCYDFANSPFAGVVMALLVPLLLTDLAEQYGCSKTKYGCDINANDILTNKQVQVYVGLWELKATSYAAAMVGLASLIQAFMFLFVGPLADYGRYRTLLFRITAIGTGICTCFYIFFGDKILWQFVGWWTVIATILLGLSIIFYNSWLPMLVETHPDIIDACKNHIPKDELKRMVEQKTDHLAIVGFSWGYCAGIIVLLICLIILLMEPSSYIYDNENLYGSINGKENIFINKKFDTFNELYAKKIISTNIYYSIANTDNKFVYINGLQFIYNGFNGNFYGNNNGTLKTLSFDNNNGIDEIIIFTESINDHICGFSFHIKGNDKIIYSNIGNITDTTDTNSNSDIISFYKISEPDMIFGGISGYIGKLDENIASLIELESDTIISSLSILFVNSDGQFSNGTLYGRIGIFINGIWFLIFTLLSIKYLKHRPGPPLPENERLYIFGLKQTLKTIMKAKQFPTLFIYLLAYFLFSDGLGTLISCGVLFGRELLNMSNSQLAFMILEVYIIGIIGAYIFHEIERKYNIQSIKMLCMHLICLTILPIWGLIGIIPSSPVGFKSIAGIYIWTFCMAIHIASMQSFARSVFAQLIPVGHESEMFALFEITDKGSSWIGPLVIAIVSDIANMRWAVFYIFLFFLIPLPIIWKLDMEKGRWEAGRSMQQVTRRASMLFDTKSINDLQNDLADIVNQVTNNDKTQKHEMTTSEALEMAIDKNLTITNEVFEQESDLSTEENP